MNRIHSSLFVFKILILDFLFSLLFVITMMKRFLSQRFFNTTKMASQGLMNCRISSSSLAVKTRVPKDPGEATVDPEPDDNMGISRRFLLREMGVKKERIRLDGISNPTVEKEETFWLSPKDVKKLLRASQIEVVKTKLLEIGQNWIPYDDFVRVCNDLDPFDGSSTAKMLEDSGNVIVLGNFVCLRPDQITKSIEGLLPLPQIRNPNDPRRKELKELEAKKALIDEEAHYLARRDLWAGLGYMIIQTAALMRLTFWELTWDVMEPICYGVTAVYFMSCYAFFLRTLREPSFQSFYQSRFEAKQRKLMESQDFDVARYYELKKLFKPSTGVSKILGTLED